MHNENNLKILLRQLTNGFDQYVPIVVNKIACK